MGVSVISIKVPVLQAGQEYTQDKRDRFNVSLPVDKVRGLTWGDKAATLYVEESDDGSTWVATKTTAIVAKTTADTGWVTLSKRYYRFRIKNGAATQGSIILYQQIVGMEEQSGIVVLDHGIPAANPVPTQLTGSKVGVMQSDPVVGERTVTSTAAEMHAGASPLAGRYEMVVLNTSANTVYWGSAGVTLETGFPLLPNDSVHFKFHPETHTAIYFIADGEFTVKVVELA